MKINCYESVFLSVDETSQVLGISKSKIYKELSRARRGLPFDCPPHSRFGTRVLFNSSDVLQWIAEKKVS